MDRNPYLVSAGGSSVASRVFPTLSTFGAILGPFGFVIVGAIFADLFVNHAHQGDVIAASIAVALLGFVGGFAWIWVAIHRSATGLGEAEALALAGDPRAKTIPHMTLARVFRNDLRLRALYVLGLLAERVGDFAEAADLFTRAGKAIPAGGMGTRAIKRAPLMCLGHAAFCNAAAGDLALSAVQLREAHVRIPSMYQAGVFDALFDDSAYMGSASLAGNLNKIEERRDPRAMVALAGALLAFKNGHFRECVDAASAEDGMLRQNLMPHEGELVEALKTDAIARLAGGEYRAGATTSLSPWAQKARGARA